MILSATISRAFKEQKELSHTSYRQSTQDYSAYSSYAAGCHRERLSCWPPLI